ncbi:MAG: 3-dehydroquinate synthase, partial [Cyanobacteriota bacterium]|nr:3-dehydroquinate synthase [Cyanobacteriota bacterium]
MTTTTPLHHIHVALERNPYDVVIGAGGLASLGQQMLGAGVQPGRRVLVVSNPDVATPYG